MGRCQEMEWGGGTGKGWELEICSEEVIAEGVSPGMELSPGMG